MSHHPSIVSTDCLVVVQTRWTLHTSVVLVQGPSPDEVALVEGARQRGFEFVGRSRTSLTLNMMGTRVSHQVLNSLDFTSQRAR